MERDPAQDPFPYFDEWIRTLGSKKTGSTRREAPQDAGAERRRPEGVRPEAESIPPSPPYTQLRETLRCNPWKPTATPSGYPDRRLISEREPYTGCVVASVPCVRTFPGWRIRKTGPDRCQIAPPVPGCASCSNYACPTTLGTPWTWSRFPGDRRYPGRTAPSVSEA